MLLQRKALYNLLQINLSRIESGELKIADLQPWQTANYREKLTEELFQQLAGLGITLLPEDFETYGKHFEAPEEMVETVATDREPLEKDEIFLILFELWRRYFPEKRTISIFCDELDVQMIAHDTGKPSEIADTLAQFQQLLDEHVDRGIDPHQAFALIQIYCATDIESFLFDYILDVIEAENLSYGVELLEGFTPYIKASLWFKYLEARTAILEDPLEGYNHFEALIQKVQHDTPLDLVEEMLFFLANTGNHTLFYALAKKAIPILQHEEDFQEFLEACYAHYDYLELKEPSLAIAKLFYSRKGLPEDTPLNPSDPGLVEITEILDQKIHFAEE